MGINSIDAEDDQFAYKPWKILEYCNSIGEIYDVVVEDMIRQANGLRG